MRFLLLIVVATVLVELGSAVKPNDAIYIPVLGSSLYLKNETYTFDLELNNYVPLNIYKHTLYTGSTATIQKAAQSIISKKRHALLELSEEDYFHLTRLVYDNDYAKVPSFVKVNRKKRSLEATPEGVNVIPLTDEVSILHFTEEGGSLKRATVPMGNSHCVHIPYFTTCPNDGGAQAVKDAIQGAMNSVRAELDSYKNTNDQRSVALGNVLTKQKAAISKLLSVADIDSLISAAGSQAAVNIANQVYGDLVAQAQINSLKRVTNSLLRYARAMASTDDRQVVAQPSMTQLFTSFKALTSYITSQKQIPILEQRNFTWVEQPLPIDAVSNVASAPSSYSPDTQSPVPFAFSVVTGYSCAYFNVITGTTTCPDSNADGCTCKTDSTSMSYDNIMKTTGLYFGPIPENLVGVYAIYPNGNTSKPVAYNVRPVLFEKAFLSNADVFDSTARTITTWYCVQFGPYKGLATFTSTPYLLNGIPANSAVLDPSECQAYQILDTSGSDSSKVVYALYGKKEMVTVPFYSNCTLAQLQSDNVTSGLAEVNYLMAWGCADSAGDCSTNVVDSTILSAAFPNMHMVSPTCAINIEPEWIGASYYLAKPAQTITSINTGFRLDQFTVNPLGELSSSLTFVYTDAWIPTYKIKRTSTNQLITTEVSLLENDEVLFYIGNNGTLVIDESDAFYGPGNNGRDCISKQASYEYDITACIYQNNLVGYDANDYFAGNQITTGVARYINKYDISYKPVGQSYQFSLTPKDNADFNFYLQTDGTICPNLVDSYADVSGCHFTFHYEGTSSPTFDGNVLIFDSSNTATASASSFGKYYSLNVGNDECMLIYCILYATADTAIQFDPPKYDIVSASDLALQTKIVNSFDTTLNNSISSIQSIIDESAKLHEIAKNLSATLDHLSFNVTGLFPYENFTKLRQQVDKQIDTIAAQQVSNMGDFSANCDTIFGGVSCFFKDLASTVVTILIIVAIVAGLYVVFFKFGLAKKLCK